jgi:3-(3-hydroxy-phenyl)propionate hydroxylase
VNERYDILITGFGPVGQVAANLLGQRGFRVAAFDVATSIYNLPRAAHYDAEVMRIFQSIGLAEAVLPACAEVKGMHFLSAKGEVLLGFNAPDRLTANGWPAGYLFYQPDLERALQDGVRRFPNVDVFAGHEVVAIEQNEGGVTVRVRDIAANSERAFEGEWLWGCDGARSLTRKALGIELEDFGLDQPWLVIDTMLRRDVDLPEVALQICDPARPSTFIPSCGRHRRWEFMLMPGEQAAEMERPETFWPLLQKWVKPDDAEVIRAVVYRFHALIARGYRRGRAFILGDAAHQMPPFLGQGMCAGIRDAANLAWKADAVRRGIAGDTLLDSYYEERAPHVRTIISRAVAAGMIIQATDPATAAARDQAFLSAEKRHHDIGESGAFDMRMPPLAGGVLDPEAKAGGATGQLFPQPLVHTDGATFRLDDAYRGGWAIVAGNDAGALFTPAVRDAWSFAEPTLVQIGGPAAGDWVVAGEHGNMLTPWLAENGACVVRPDLYVYGVARSADDLLRLAAALRGQLA